MNGRRKATAVIIVLGVVGLLALIYFRLSGEPGSLSAPQRAGSRIPELKRLVEQQEKESTEAVAAYAPTTAARIDDLTTSPETILRGLPGVVKVEVLVRAEQPTCRIVHLRDWHYVPKDLFAIDVRNAAGRELTDEEIDRLHEEHCYDVELVQLEQMALLRCLVRHHGLSRIFGDGFSKKELPSYTEKVSVLRDMERTQIPRLRKQLGEVRELMRDMETAGRQDTDNYRQACGMEREITGMLWQHTKNLLEMGAAGRLLIDGEIAEVLPLEDAKLLDLAKPITPDGKVRFDKEKVKARNDAQVRAVLDHGHFGLIVLGGAHDLSESVRRLGGKCEYIRLTTKQFRQLNGE